MPAPARYEPPHEQLLRLAELAKGRGLTFEQWWNEATRPRWCTRCDTSTLQPNCPVCDFRTLGPAPVLARDSADERPPGAVVWPTDTADRRTSLAAVDESREAWRRSWYGEPQTKPERAVLRLRELWRSLDAPDGAQGNDVEIAVA